MSQIRNLPTLPNLPNLSGPATPSPATPSSAQATPATTPRQAVDTFQGTAAPPSTPSTPPDPVQARQEAALNRYQERLSEIFGPFGSPSAADLALGKSALEPARSGEVSPEQQKQLLEASKDLLLDLPLSALSEPATARAKAYLETRGVDTQGFEQKTLRELGPVGEDLAKRLAADLKGSAPGAYYGLAAAGAVAVGAYGAVKGSDALQKLGIKPEFKTSLFGDQVKARAEASWGAKLKDPNLTLGADGTFKVNPATTLRVGANARLGGASVGQMGLQEGEAKVGLERQNASLQARATLGEGGRVTGGEVQGRARLGADTSLRADLALGARGRIQQGSLQAQTTLGSVKADAVAHLAAGGAISSGQVKLSTEQALGPAGRDAFSARLQGNADVGGRFAGLEAAAQYTRKTPTALHVQGSLQTDGAMTLTRANAQARLSNDVYSLGVGMNFDRPSDVLGYRIEGSAKTPVGLTLRGEAALDRRFAIEKGNLGVEGTLQQGPLQGVNLRMQGNFVEGGRFAGMTGTATYDQKPWKLSAAVDHNVLEQRSTGSLSVGYTPRPNLDIQVRGSLDTRGDSRIGAGLVWRF